MDKYDVIVLGGSIAGLSLASELCKKHKVLVIEKRKIIELPISWVTEKSLIEKVGLQDAINSSFSKCFLQGYNKKRFYVYDQGVAVDEIKVLKFFTNIILKQGGVIHMGECFESHEVKKNEVEVTTKKGKYSCKILIDCMGIDSPIAEPSKIHKRKFFLPVWGGIYEGYNLNPSEVVLGNFFVEDNPPLVFEVFPYSKNKVSIAVFNFSKEYTNYDHLKKYHKEYVSTLKKEFKTNITKVRDIYGVIPVGSTHYTATDRVFFFGDSGLLSSPVLASGFTNVLQYYRKIAEHISICISNDKTDQKNLSYKYTWEEELNRDTLLLMTVILCNLDYKDIDEFLNIWDLAGSRIIVDLLFMRLTPEEVIKFGKILINYVGIKKLTKVVPTSEYPYFIRKFGEIALDSYKLKIR